MCLHLHAVGLIGTNIMDIGRHDNLGCSIAIKVACRGIVIEYTMGIAGVVTELRPARAQRTAMFINPGICFVIRGAGNNDFGCSISVNVTHHQSSQLIGDGALRPS